MRGRLSFLLGITTCYGKQQLVESIRSIRESYSAGNFRIVIIADSEPLTDSIKRKLKRLRCEVFENSVPSSAFNKQLQILKMTTEELVIFTQDDILFDKGLIERVVREFEHDNKLTYLCVKNQPLNPLTLIEKGTACGVSLLNRIAQKWNSGDNYLAALGRLMAFRTSWIKKLSIPINCVSLDAVLYFENKLHGGKFKCVWDNQLYFRTPQVISEQMKKSSRFLNSKLEMLSYNRYPNLDYEYRMPIWDVVRAIWEELWANLEGLVVYMAIWVYTRMFKQNANKCLTAMWDVDCSTKVLLSK